MNKQIKLAISSKRSKNPLFYSRLNKIGGRHFTTGMEEWQVCLLCDAGGYSYKSIAKWVFGDGPKYVPTKADIGRVGRILRANGRKVRDWRNGETKESQQFAHKLIRRPVKSGQPKLKIA